MRVACLILTLVPVCGFSQVWEKSIAPGIVYRMEVDTQTPRVIHAFRFARENGSIGAMPQLAQGTVYGKDDERKGRDSLSAALERTQAIAGVNGDFFPWTGDPLGMMMTDGTMVSKPYPGRSAFGWGKGYSAISRLKWTGTVSFTAEDTLKFDGLNEACGKDMLVMNTSSAGYALAESASLQAILELAGPITPNGTWTGKVIAVVTDETRVPVGKGQVVVTATGKAVGKLSSLKKGSEATIKFTTTGLDWDKAKNVIGGGPVIVAQGKSIQAWDAEDFRDEFVAKRHPRTAIGSTKDGDIWLVEIEGRQALSVGATIEEMSTIMVRLGCMDAMNLDGGGSSELALRGMIVNRPSDGAERPIANALLLFAPMKESNESVEYVIKGRAKLPQGSATDYKVVDQKGRDVPLSKVVWSASGDAWIDQGGRLRSLQAGKATVKAWIEGKVVSLPVVVESLAPVTGGR